MKRYTLVFVPGFMLLFALAFVAEAQQPRKLHLCYDTMRHTVRLVGLGGVPASCSSNERELKIPYGTNCWDINGNTQLDDFEDINDDDNWNALDCRGDKGPPGPAGSQGPPGQACWDTNGNGEPNLSTEDTNGDNVVDVLDCKGPPGPPISDCTSVEFPTANGTTTIGRGRNMTDSCPAGFFAISMEYQAKYGKLKAYYPNATSGGCECVSDWDCQVEKEMIVLRCCK